MDILKLQGVRLLGVCACLPENLLDNASECAQLYGESLPTLLKATGIHARCIASPGTTALDLGVCAAKELMKATYTEPSEIGGVVCVTFTPEHMMPADAPRAQARLGLSKHSVAFDIHMACSGYLYGLYVAGMFAKTLNKKILLLDGDIQSAFVSKEDKATLPVMSDAGTATLIEPVGESEEPKTAWNFTFYTNGEERDTLKIPAGGSKNPIQLSDLEYREDADGSKRRNTDIFMDGFGIFRFVSMEVSKWLLSFMQTRQIDGDNLDCFVPHQANIYMVEQLSKKLKIPADKLWKSGERYGNPGSASVPLTIADNATEWFAQGKTGHALLSGFGGGLSAGACDLWLPPNGFYSVIRYTEREHV